MNGLPVKPLSTLPIKISPQALLSTPVPKFHHSATHEIQNLKFKTVIKKGIQLNNRKLVNTILYADDQILMATSEDDLQTVAHHLNLIARKYKMTISSTKTKSMAMWGNHIQRVKIVIKRQYY